MVASSDLPVLLMPVRLETRFVSTKHLVGGKEKIKNELWVRIFPDEIFLNSFEPKLTEEELTDRKRYLFDLQNTENTTRENLWQILVNKYGVYRAAWLIHAEEKYVNPNHSDFEGLQSEETAQDFIFQWLPDNFHLYLYKPNGGKPTIEKGIEIPITIDRAGLKVLEGEENWLNTFYDRDGKKESAINKGMGVKIELEEDIQHFEKIIAIGLRDDEVAPSAEVVQELLKSHQHTHGFSFLEYGTPTNNLGKKKSGFSSRDEFDAKGSFDRTFNQAIPKATPLEIIASTEEYERKLTELVTKIKAIEKNDLPNLIENNVTYAEQFAKGLGFDLKEFGQIAQADQQMPRLNYLIQKATWFALGGQVLQQLFGSNISPNAHEFIWEFYFKYVQNRGPYPAIKIGDLPYGVLPVTNWRKIFEKTSLHVEGTTLQEKLKWFLANFAESWLKMAKNRQSNKFVPRMEDTLSPDTELVSMLSMEPVSSSFQLRILELEKMHGVLPGWLEKSVTTPQHLYAYPPKLVDEFLENKPAYKLNFDEADKIYKEDLAPLTAGFLPDEKKHLLKYAPTLAFKEIGVTTYDDLDFPITRPDDWHIKDYYKLVQDRLNDDTTFFYQGRTDFLLFELLEKSNSNALSLYSTTVYFEPTKADIEGISAYTISFSPAQKNKINNREEFKAGEKVATLISQPVGKKLEIKAPFDGVIEKIFTEDGTKVGDRRKLFKIKNEEKYTQIKRKMAALQAQVIIEIERLKTAGTDIVQAQKTAVFEAMDLNSFRLDAWLTGLAQQEVEFMRKSKKKGFYFGAYGWVENLRKNSTPTIIDETKSVFVPPIDPYDLDGGIIHTPSISQAVSAAMFRQSFSTYKEKGEKANPYTLNLTSDRIQKAKQLLDGLRQGQQIEALLGYRLERFLHENGADNQIHKLRKEFPLTVNKLENGQPKEQGLATLTVINGLQIIKEFKRGNRVIKDGIKQIADILDASTDLLFYESGYQMTQGNFSQAAAAMDAAKGMIEPPEPDSINTKLEGIGQVHKLAMLFDAPEEVPKSPDKNPKAYLEPVLENWLKELIGGMELIACNVSLSLINKTADGTLKETPFSETNLVTLDELNIGYLDFLHLGQSSLGDDATELEQRIVQVVRTKMESNKQVWPTNIQYKLTDAIPNNKQSLKDTLAMLAYIHDLFGKSRYLKTEDIAANEDFEKENENQLDLSVFRQEDLTNLQIRLKECIAQLNRQDTPIAVLAAYELESAKGIFARLNTIEKAALTKKSRAAATLKAIEATDLLNKWAEDQAPLTQIDHLESVAHHLFGKAFRLIIPFIPTNSFKKAIQVDQKMLVGDQNLTFENQTVGGEECIRQWVEGRAEVDPQTATFSDFLMVCENWADVNPDQLRNSYLQQWNFKIVQYTPKGQYPWIALEETSLQKIQAYNKKPVLEEVDGAIYPKDSQSLVLYSPNNLAQKAVQYGLFIDQFTEKIPYKKMETSVAFQYNAPNNEAQQSLLLAVPPDRPVDGKWTIEMLKDILNDAIDLTKIRMVDSDAMQKYDYALPMSFWSSIPENLL